MVLVEVRGTFFIVSIRQGSGVSITVESISYLVARRSECGGVRIVDGHGEIVRAARVSNVAFHLRLLTMAVKVTVLRGDVVGVGDPTKRVCDGVAFVKVRVVSAGYFGFVVAVAVFGGDVFSFVVLGDDLLCGDGDELAGAVGGGGVVALWAVADVSGGVRFAESGFVADPGFVGV